MSDETEPRPGLRPVRFDATNADKAEGRDVTLFFDTTRCIHARHCVTRAPKTFLANVEGPWLHPDRSPPELLESIAEMCPSGAIHVLHKTDTPDEQVPEVNLIHIRENGPLAVRADIDLDGEAIGYRATLCRCGKSANKPFCDGSHHGAGFEATGEPEPRHTGDLKRRDGPLSIRPQRNGPLMLVGAVEICGGAGTLIERTKATRLCRCGGSSTKPFCDGTHKEIGFVSDD